MDEPKPGQIWQYRRWPKGRGPAREVQITDVVKDYVRLDAMDHYLPLETFYFMFKDRPGRARKECVGCGACCVGMTVRLEKHEVRDVQAALNAHHKRKVRLPMFEGGRWPFGRILGDIRALPTKDGNCSALTGTVGKDAGCGIYKNRPTICRYFLPGEPQCQDARERAGLPKLKTTRTSTKSSARRRRR